MKIVVIIASLLGTIYVHAQGTFQNLDFESATLSPLPPGQAGGEVPIASALPGWSALYGTTPATQVLQNNYDLGAANVTILGPNWNGTGIIAGSYTVILQAGLGPNGTLVGTSLFQNGTVPAGTRTLEFDAGTFQATGNSPLTISFAGNTLTTFVLSSGVSPSGQSYNVYGANISQYAGQSGQLEFTAPFDNWIALDDISFSPNAVPEPSLFVLSAVAGLLFSGYRRFTPKLR